MRVALLITVTNTVDVAEGLLSPDRLTLPHPTPSAAYDREGSYLVARFFDVYHAVNTLKAFVYQAIYDSLHL